MEVMDSNSDPMLDFNCWSEDEDNEAIISSYLISPMVLLQEKTRLCRLEKQGALSGSADLIDAPTMAGEKRTPLVEIKNARSPQCNAANKMR